MIGKCLCGRVEFSINGKLPDFYQCHCSLCRKLSGSASDTATFLDLAQFNWIRGKENINVFRLPSGYRSDFCKTCGSTVPHLMENKKQYWIPAGLLEGVTESVVAAHLFVASKAAWDHIGDGGKLYENMPAMKTLHDSLQRKVDEK